MLVIQFVFSAFCFSYLQFNYNLPICSAVTHNAFRVGGVGFYSQAGQIGHRVANDSPPLRRFFKAVKPWR